MTSWTSRLGASQHTDSVLGRVALTNSRWGEERAYQRAVRRADAADRGCFEDDGGTESGSESGGESGSDRESASGNAVAGSSGRVAGDDQRMESSARGAAERL